MFELYQKVILREQTYGVIGISYPHRVLKKAPALSENVQDTMLLLYKNITAFQDDCVRARLMQLATYPLSALYMLQKTSVELAERFTIHLVGTEFIMIKKISE